MCRSLAVADTAAAAALQPAVGQRPPSEARHLLRERAVPVELQLPSMARESRVADSDDVAVQRLFETTRRSTRPSSSLSMPPRQKITFRAVSRVDIDYAVEDQRSASSRVTGEGVRPMADVRRSTSLAARSAETNKKYGTS